MRRKVHSDRSTFYMLGISALFLAGFLLLVLFGARCYRSAVRTQQDNYNTRALLAFLATTVKSCDTESCVEIETEDGASVLLLRPDGTGSEFCTRIFLADGTLYEYYGRESMSLNPKYSTALGTTEWFNLSINGSFLRIETDMGNVEVNLHCVGGAE